MAKGRKKYAAQHLREFSAAAANPDANFLAIYAKNDGNLYQKNSAGTESIVTMGSDPSVNSITTSNTGLHILDTDASHDLIIKPGSNLTSDKTLTITTGDSDRTLTINGNPTLNDWFDQAVKTTSSPQFVDGTFSGDVSVTGQITVGGEVIAVDQRISTSDNILALNFGEPGAGITNTYAGIEIDRGSLNPYRFLYNESVDNFRVGEFFITINYTGLSGTFQFNEKITGGTSGAVGYIVSDTGSALKIKVSTGVFQDTETITGDTSAATATVSGAPATTDNTQAVATREDTPNDNGVGFWDAATSKFETSSSFTYNGTSLSLNNAVISGGTNTFNITNGTASLDVAAGSVVNIDANLAVESASAINQDLTTDADANLNSLELASGLVVGFAGTPNTDTVAVGDASFGLNYSGGTAPLLNFDANDFFDYTRSTNTFGWTIGAAQKMSLSDTVFKVDGATFNIDTVNNRVGIGLTDPDVELEVVGSAKFSSGLVVGFDGGAVADAIQVGDGNFYLNYTSGNPLLNFDANDYIQYTRASNLYAFNVGGVSQFEISGTSTAVKSLGAGDVQSDANGVLSVTSDQRLKKDIVDFDRGLKEILSLQPRTYRWNEQSPNESSRTYAGFIAQEVMDYIPESVDLGPDGFYAFSDRPIVAALVNSIKELKQEIEQLKAA